MAASASSNRGGGLAGRCGGRAASRLGRAGCLGGRGRRSRLLAAGQVVKRVGVDVVGDDAERRRRSGWLRVTESVPEGVGVADQLASDCLPVLLSVLGGSLSLARLVTRHWPASLGNPDGLAVGSSDSSLVRLIEERLGVLDRVVESRLEVWVSVETEPVNSLNDGAVRTIGPVVPGVNVTNWEAPVLGLDLVDVLNQSVWTSTNTRLVDDTSWADTVQILRSDTQSNDQVGEFASVLLNSVLNSLNLVGDVRLSSGGPDTEQKLGVGGDSGGDGRDGVVGRAALDAGVETRRVPSGCASELLCLLEVGLYERVLLVH